MKNNNLLKTNLLVSIILIIGFALTAVFSYKANYRTSLDNIEEVSTLTAEGIYYQLTTMFSKPVNISLTMAHDSLLAEHLMDEEEQRDEESYIETTRTYLENYKEKYGFDSVFLVSDATRRYYNFDGVDRVLTEEDPENVWYFDLMDSDLEYSLAVDNDEVAGADNKITVFVNCKVESPEGDILGVVGVGIRIDYLKELLQSYEDNYNVKASLINGNGLIQISTTYTGYEKTDWFGTYGKESIRDQVLGWKKDSSNLELWTDTSPGREEESYVVVRYIPELSWNLIVEQDTEQLSRIIQLQLRQTAIMLTVVILIVLLIITLVIRNFDKQITDLMEERQAVFKRATEQMYDNIYELNITKNCYVGKRTEEYFESLGAKGLPYDQGLYVIAEKEIKPEFRDGYVSTFTPENVIREYEMGKNHLRYDFMISQDGINYHWMRIDAHIFYSSEDDSLHMFTYRKNIDAEKQREQQAETDEMTGFLTKKAAERCIQKELLESPQEKYAFFIFDIDNFKQANDLFGHAFGDLCIQRFTGIIRDHFRDQDLFGRLGGDEFVVFAKISDESWVKERAAEVSAALNTVCSEAGNESSAEGDGPRSWGMSASMGVAIAPRDGTNFQEIYRNADEALYQTKRNGKNGFTVFNS